MAKKELEELKKKVETERKKYEEDVETKKLKQELFRLNHRKTVKIAFNIENIAKGLGKMMIGVGKKLGEMDKELTEKRLKEQKKAKKNGEEPQDDLQILMDM